MKKFYKKNTPSQQKIETSNFTARAAHDPLRTKKKWMKQLIPFETISNSQHNSNIVRGQTQPSRNKIYGDLRPNPGDRPNERHHE